MGPPQGSLTKPEPKTFLHSSCHIWRNQPEKALPHPFPWGWKRSGAAESLSPLPHIVSEGLSDTVPIRLLEGIQPWAQEGWAFSEAPTALPSQAEVGASFMEGTPRAKTGDPTCLQSRMGLSTGPSLSSRATALHKSTLSPCCAPGPPQNSHPARTLTSPVRAGGVPARHQAYQEEKLRPGRDEALPPSPDKTQLFWSHTRPTN